METKKIEKALQILREGKIVLVTDNEDRENEGDLICFSRGGNHRKCEFYGKLC